MNRIAPACSGECTGAIRNAAGSGVTGGESAAFTSLNLNAAAAWKDTRLVNPQLPTRPIDDMPGADRRVLMAMQAIGINPGSQHLFQSGIRRSQRANAVFKAEVPNSTLPDSAARNGVVDILNPIPYPFNKLSDRLPIAAAKTCRSCGRYKAHWPWCPTLPLLNVLAVHVQEHATEKHTWVGAEISP